MSDLPKGSPSVAVSVKPPSTSSDLSSLDGSDDEMDQDGDRTMDGSELSSNQLASSAASGLPPTASTSNPFAMPATSSHAAEGSVSSLGAMDETHVSSGFPPPSAYTPAAPRSLSSALSPPADGSSPTSTTEPLPASPRSSPPPPPAPPLATTSRIRAFPKDAKRRPQPPPPPPPPQEDDEGDEEEDEEEEDEEDEEDDEQDPPTVASGSRPSAVGNESSAARVSGGMWADNQDEPDSDLTPDEDEDEDRQDEDDEDETGLTATHKQLARTSAVKTEDESFNGEGPSSAPTTSRTRRSPNGYSTSTTTPSVNGVSATSKSKRPSPKSHARRNASPSTSSSSSRVTQQGGSTSANGASVDGAHSRASQARRGARKVSVESSASSEGSGSQPGLSRTSTASRTPNGASSSSKAKSGAHPSGPVHISGGSSRSSGTRKRALSSASQQAGSVGGPPSMSADGKRRRTDDEGPSGVDGEDAEEDDADESMVDKDGADGDLEDDPDRSVALGDDEDEDAKLGEDETAEVGVVRLDDEAADDEEAAEDAAALDGEEADEEADAAAEEDSEEQSATVPFALQHRQDAMEALTKIEITFARLRDRLHVERMEECLREEESLLDGSHPVLVHLQTRLGSLRERELTLSTRRIAQVEKEFENVRKADVSAVWEWWRNGREELQRDMMADVMRKRRRVDREKRAVEGGRPKRPIPQPQPGALPNRRPDRRGREPDMDDLLPGSYLRQPEQRTRLREEREVWGPRPGLLGLAEKGRAEDLELLGLGPLSRQQPYRTFEQTPQPGMMQAAPMAVHPHHHHHQVPQPQQPPSHVYQPHPHQMHAQQPYYAQPAPPPPHHHQQPQAANPHSYQYRPRSPVNQPDYNDPAYHPQQPHHRSQSALSHASSSRPTGRTLSGTNGAGMTISGSTSTALTPSEVPPFGGASESTKRRRTESPVVVTSAPPKGGLVDPPRSFLPPVHASTIARPQRNNSDPAAAKGHRVLSPSVLHPPPEPALTSLQIGGGLKEGAGGHALGGFSFHGQEGLVGGPGTAGASGRD